MLDKEQIKNWDSAKDQPPQSPAEQAMAGLADAQKEDLFQGEAVFTGEYVTLTPDQAKARKRRGQWIALGLFSFCILIFLITMTRMGQNLMVGGA
jgi:hypothetical protein